MLAQCPARHPPTSGTDLAGAAAAYFGQNIWPSMALAAPPNILMALLLENGLIGYGGLVHLSWENRRGELSFLVDEKRAKDLAQYATDFASFLSLAKFMAFDDLGLNRIFTETFALRVHHISVLETAGFQREGVMREHVKIGDSFVDSIVHGLLRE